MSNNNSAVKVDAIFSYKSYIATKTPDVSTIINRITVDIMHDVKVGHLTVELGEYNLNIKNTVVNYFRNECGYTITPNNSRFYKIVWNIPKINCVLCKEYSHKFNNKWFPCTSSDTHGDFCKKCTRQLSECPECGAIKRQFGFCKVFCK